MTAQPKRKAILRPVEDRPKPTYDQKAVRERVRMLTVRESGYTWRTVDDYVRVRERER